MLSDEVAALDAKITALSKPDEHTMSLSLQCWNTARDITIDESADLAERWLCGQWVASFETMGTMAGAHVALQQKLIFHTVGIAVTMKKVNLPFWHLFTEMTDIMMSQFDEIMRLVVQREALKGTQ